MYGPMYHYSTVWSCGPTFCGWGLRDSFRRGWGCSLFPRWSFPWVDANFVFHALCWRKIVNSLFMVVCFGDGACFNFRWVSGAFLCPFWWKLTWLFHTYLESMQFIWHVRNIFSCIIYYNTTMFACDRTICGSAVNILYRQSNWFIGTMAWWWILNFGLVYMQLHYVWLAVNI